MIRRLAVLILLLVVSPVWATNYFLDPLGNDANTGTDSAHPWKTFAYAITPARASCGDHLILAPGNYGDGYGTGKLLVNGLHCSNGSELVIESQDQRQAKIFDDGGGVAARILTSSYIILDGLHLASQDRDLGGSSCDRGRPLEITRANSSSPGSDHITFRNNLASQQNRWCNGGMWTMSYSTDILGEDNEAYIFSRHCGAAIAGENVVIRRHYCNPRGGKIPGGFSEGGRPLGSGDAIFSMYPCKNCIVENSIADGTESPMFIAEQNANFNSSILQTGAKVYGNIDYKNSTGNSIQPNSRNVTDTNHSPQNTHIKDNAMIAYSSAGTAINGIDPMGMTVEHNTVLGTDSAGGGFRIVDGTYGTTASQLFGTFLDNLIKDAGGTAFSVVSGATYSGNNNRVFSSATGYSPALPGNWGTTYSNDPQMGTCKFWLPDGSVGKGQGTGGSDIGATILYRYVNGVLTTTPLWDPDTGAFPHGATVEGINDVPGKSLFDFHLRTNVNTGGCPFPASYTAGGGGGPSTVVIGNTAASPTNCTNNCSWPMTVSPNQDRAAVCLVLWDDAQNVGSVTSVDISGQLLTRVPNGRQVTSPGWRDAEMWTVANPIAGARTVNVLTTGNVTGMLGRSIELDGTAGLNTAAGATAPPSAPNPNITVTAPTNSNELIVDCAASSKNFTLSADASQLAYANLNHDTKALTLGMSTKDGSNGGVERWTAGGNVYWPIVAQSFQSIPIDPPTTALLTIDQFKIQQLTGPENAPTALAALNTQAEIGSNGAFRVRMRITASVATSNPFGVQLYCRKDAEPLTRAFDTFEGKIFRLYGSEVNENIPTSLTATTNQLCSSNCVPGAFLRDQSVFVVPAMTAGQHIELEWAVQAQGAPSNSLQCYPYRDDGTPLDVASVTPTVQIVENAASVGF